MNRTGSALLLAGLLSLAFSNPVFGGVCDDVTWGQATGPVALGLLEGGLGEGHRACGRSEAGIGAGGMLVVDLPNFYGRLSADVRLRGSFAVTDRLELFGRFEFFRFDYLITPLSASALGIGHTNLGANVRLLHQDRVALSLHAQVVLPTAVPLYSGMHPLAMDFGLAGQFRLHSKVAMHADLGLIHSVGLGAGPAQPKVGGTATVGAEFRVASRVAVVTDLHASFGYTAPVDILATALALRLSDGKRFGFDLGATIPLAGRERAAVRLDFLWTLRLGAITPASPTAKPGSKPAPPTVAPPAGD